MPSFVPHPRPNPKKRSLQKVPFVELFNGRLQGVVSSSGSHTRVYVSLIKAGSGDYMCKTNNNRPCGGLRGGPCKHLQALVDNAIFQYGQEHVSQYLKVTPQDNTAWRIISTLSGQQTKEPAGEVFARFLAYLRYVELPTSTEPTPEMAWFVTQ